MENFNGIEDQLTSKLQFLSPNPLFIDRLRTRIFDSSEIELEEPKKRSDVLFYSIGIISFIAAFIWLCNYIWSFFRENDQSIDLSLLSRVTDDGSTRNVPSGKMIVGTLQ